MQSLHSTFPIKNYQGILSLDIKERKEKGWKEGNITGSLYLASCILWRILNVVKTL